MKNILAIFAFIFSVASVFAQSESVKPTYGVELERVIHYAEIERKVYTDITITLKAAEIGDMFVEGVRVVITDNQTGKKIYKKRFSKSRLYAFSDGQIEVGKGNALDQIIIWKSKSTGLWHMELKEKGIY